MARGRMLNRVIVKSLKFESLIDDFNRLTYCLLLPFADRDGKMDGDPCLVKSMIYPRRSDVTAKKVEKALEDLSNIGLIEWYPVNGDKYIQICNFLENQSGLSYNKEPASILPEVPGILPEVPGILPGKEKLREEKDKRSIREENTGTRVKADFSIFFNSYPRKENEDDAMKAFKIRYKDLPAMDVLIAVIERWIESSKWKEEGGKYIPHPATWLRKGGWKNEPPLDDHANYKHGGSMNFEL